MSENENRTLTEDERIGIKNKQTLAQTVSKLPLYEIKIFINRWNEYEKLNKLLLYEIEEHKKEDPKGLPYTNQNCWRGMKKYKCEPDLGKAISSMISVWCDHYLPNKWVDATMEYWANVNDPGGWNDFHHHRFANDADLSGVYYVQAGETGIVRFTTPEQMWGIIPKHMPFSKSVGHMPRDGDILLWQSHVLHDVPPNPSPTKQRINVAFNVSLKIRDKTQKDNVLKMEDHKK